FLATQQQVVVGSIIRHFPEEFEAHAALELPPCEPELIAELIDINGGVALLDERHRRKQMDWSFNKWDSGTVPVEFYQAVVPPWLAGNHYEPVVLRSAG
ncbi:MAG TPA: hypothetical protein VM942_03115, partial [Acidimicrobiales bacterium]|nr:hypothetical protein [Acidimicrobiales bacterium]